MMKVWFNWVYAFSTFITQSDVEKAIFDCHLHTPASTSLPWSDTKGIYLPKLDVPMFNVNILMWKTFGNSFVHVYQINSFRLRKLKDGTTKRIIKGVPYFLEISPHLEIPPPLKSRRIYKEVGSNKRRPRNLAAWKRFVGFKVRGMQAHARDSHYRK